ncbi:MAG: hypothetical protein HPY65_00920 [Syntrophaceae bacterium]|nr:hypothetical protein [Syntrophaceae bacterium]
MSFSSIDTSTNSMVYSLGRKNHTRCDERVQKGETASWSREAEDFACIVSVGDTVSTSEEAKPASNTSDTDRSAVSEKSREAGLYAVLEKLAARSDQRPDVRGLRNAAEHILANLERRGYTVPSSSSGTEESPVDSIASTDASTDDLQAASGTAENGESEVESTGSGESFTETYPAADELIVMASVDPFIAGSSQSE